MGKQKLHLERLYSVVGKPQAGALAAGYVRSSSDMQDPATLITQKRRIQEYAESNGWHIVRWFEEPEISATFEEIEKRPVFAELLVEAGRELPVVLCYSNDRWARNAAVAYMSLDTLRDKRVWWATADELWDIDKVQEDGTDVAFAIDTQFNAAFARRLSKRAIDGKEDRARDGYHNGSVSFGYLPPDYPKAPDGAPSTWKPPRMPVRRDPVNFPALVRLGELAAQGWSDAAIADELVGHVSTTPRFGQRPLTKDTVAAMRRMWFPREFAPGSGHGTIETPSGELVEGRHPAAWPYELWQQMVEAKNGNYHRPQTRIPRQVHEFSRIICCAACGRPLRVDSAHGIAYYKDTSLVRRLPCTAFGSLSVPSRRVVQQFGSILRSVQLPDTWRDAVSQHCCEIVRDEGTEQLVAHRAELEDERRRLVAAFAKGYITENELDLEIEHVRVELRAMPRVPAHRTAGELTLAAIGAGETLTEMASHWDGTSQEERRDIVWALLGLNGLVYDLQRQGIVGLIPGATALPALLVGLHQHWDRRDQGLWLREEYTDAHTLRSEVELEGLPYRAHRLTMVQRREALALIQTGMPPRHVAERFQVSKWVILRLIKRHSLDSPQHQPKLVPEQEALAFEMLHQGQSLRQVGSHFGVSYTSIWRMVRRAAERGTSKGG